MLRIAWGISTIARPISPSVAPADLGAAAMRAFSSSLSGNSGTRQIDHRIVVIESTAPTMNEICVIVGMLCASTALRSIPTQ